MTPRATNLVMLLLITLLLQPTGARAQDSEPQGSTAANVMSRFLKSCLTQIHDPSAAIDAAIADLDLSPAAEETAQGLLSSGAGIAWIDTASRPGIVLAISTTTYHCAVATDEINGGEAWVQFAALVLELEKQQGKTAELSQSELAGEGEADLLQSFASFTRERDGNVTTIDLVRPAAPDTLGLMRLSATISVAD